MPPEADNTGIVDDEEGIQVKLVVPPEDSEEDEEEKQEDVEEELGADKNGAEEDRTAQEELIHHHDHHHHEEYPPYPQYPPSLFTDQDGNLKFVTLVCKSPCTVFTVIMVTCVVLTIVLFYLVAKAGNPFVTPGSQYDIHDIRSTAFDSVRLAMEEVDLQRALNALQDDQATPDVIRPQEEVIDQTFWIFESETEDLDVFGTEESIRAMKEAFDLFVSDDQFSLYCQLDYDDDDEDEDDDDDTTNSTNATTTTTTKTQKEPLLCKNYLSPLNMYYASVWDPELVQSVLHELEADYPSNILRYNFLGLCVEFDILCTPFMDDEDLQWANDLNDNITKITDTWDAKGELNPNITQVTLLAAYLSKLNTKRGLIDFGFDKNFNLTNLKSRYSRGIIFWGGPLNNQTYIGNYNRTEEDKDEEILKPYLVENFLEGINEISSNDHNDELNSYFFMGSLILEILFDIVQRDATLAVASFLFVCLYIRLSLGSCFLAAIGLLEIVLSLPVSWFLYTYVFQIKYFSFLNSLALFIVAAIGADDIFIFMDAYKQSGNPNNVHSKQILSSLESRMSWVYRRTGTAMAITSATTCTAFLCTLATPLDDVRAFGIFAALVILIDYILVMTLFCTAVVIYHNKFESTGCCCCSQGCKTQDPSPTTLAFQNIPITTTHKAAAMTSSSRMDSHVTTFTDDDTHTNLDTAKTGGAGGGGSHDAISSFFGTKVAAVILDLKGRIVIGIIFVVWIIISSMFATQLKPTQNTEQFLDDNHPLQKAFTILGNEFKTAENDIALPVLLTWGVDDVDREGVNRLLKPDFFGKPVFVDSFSLNEECQVEMVNACYDLKTNATHAPYIKQVNGLGVIKCFMEEFGAYAAFGNLENCDSVKKGVWKDVKWTVPEEELPSFMDKFLEQRTCYSDRNTSILSYYGQELGWDGNQFKYASISVENSILDPFTAQPEPVAMEQYKAMINIANDLNVKTEQICGSKVMMTDLEQKFTFMNNQRIYVRSAISSSLLGVGIAFTVLFISTRLFHIALLATLSIASVLVSVLGTMVMLGWELGSIEAILISVVAGFSVDYVVHLAHSYESAMGNTNIRIRQAFREMGISVMNGMVTSVGASIPLFFCRLQFFSKFGTFLCIIIAFSWFFANFAFMSALAQLKIPISAKKQSCGI